MSGGRRASVDGVVVVVGELLERLALGLLDQQGAEAAHEHEEGIDLEDVVQPGVLVGLGSAVVADGCDGALADDGADL